MLEAWTTTNPGQKPPTFHTCENGTVLKKSKAVLSSVEKPRNLTYWEWVFSQTLPAEWREPQIYSVIKIVFFHFIFHDMASLFFLCCSILWALKKCLCILVHWGLGILLENSTPRGNCAINSMRMPPSAINTACAKQMGDVRHKFPFPVRAATRNGWSYAHLYKNKNVLFAVARGADGTAGAAPGLPGPPAPHGPRHSSSHTKESTVRVSHSPTGPVPAQLVHKQWRNAGFFFLRSTQAPVRECLLKERCLPLCKSDLDTQSWLNSPSLPVQNHWLLDFKVRIFASFFLSRIFPTVWAYRVRNLPCIYIPATSPTTLTQIQLLFGIDTHRTPI